MSEFKAVFIGLDIMFIAFAVLGCILIVWSFKHRTKLTKIQNEGTTTTGQFLSKRTYTTEYTDSDYQKHTTTHYAITYKCILIAQNKPTMVKITDQIDKKFYKSLQQSNPNAIDIRYIANDQCPIEGIKYCMPLKQLKIEGGCMWWMWLFVGILFAIIGSVTPFFVHIVSGIISVIIIIIITLMFYVCLCRDSINEPVCGKISIENATDAELGEFIQLLQTYPSETWKNDFVTNNIDFTKYTNMVGNTQA
eukprot:520074_1